MLTLFKWRVQRLPVAKPLTSTVALRAMHQALLGVRCVSADN